MGGEIVKAQESTVLSTENNVQEKLEEDNSLFWGISLKDIINSAIGAFLGFGASLILEKRTTSANKRKSINNIISELQSVRDGIRESIIVLIPDKMKNAIYKNLLVEGTDWEIRGILERIDKKIIEMAYVIYLPIWENVLQAGDILEFKDKPYFDAMICVYTKIYRLKAIIESYYNENQNDMDLERLTVILKECLDLDAIFSDANNPITKLLKD